VSHMTCAQSADTNQLRDSVLSHAPHDDNNTNTNNTNTNNRASIHSFAMEQAVPLSPSQANKTSSNTTNNNAGSDNAQSEGRRTNRAMTWRGSKYKLFGDVPQWCDRVLVNRNNAYSLSCKCMQYGSPYSSNTTRRPVYACLVFSIATPTHEAINAVSHV
jgi:hypothetical protein